MDKYLKMADVFTYSAKKGTSLVCGKTFVAKFVDAVECECAANAINSHDELVAMNQELLAALESVIEWYDMEADHSIEPDFYKRMAACQVSEDMAREAIAKAKAAS